MARKEQSITNQRLASVDSLYLQERVETWLGKIRSRLPEGGTLVVTVHKVSRQCFLVAFRATAFGEVFTAEAREKNLEAGVEEAGRCLFERLSLNPPLPKANFGEKVRRLILSGGEAG